MYRTHLTAGLALVVVLPILIVPALWNFYPLLFPDSIAYLQYADYLTQGRLPFTDRPAFYGLAIWPLHADRSLWPVVVVQAVIVAVTIRATVRALAPSFGAARFVLLVGALVAVSPLAWHVSMIMPDILAGVSVLSLFLIGVCRDRLGRGGRAGFALLAWLCVLVHPTHLAIAAVLIVVAAVARWRVPSLRDALHPGAMAAPTFAALAFALAFNAAVFGEVTLNPGGPPFLLGRMLADGPARAYLREACPSTPYALCADLDRIPHENWEILWKPDSPLRTSSGFRPEIMAEAGDIVAATVLAHPIWVAADAGHAFVQQIVTIRSELVTGPTLREVSYWTPYALPGFVASRQGHGAVTAAMLDKINLLHEGVYIIGAGLLVTMLPGLWGDGRRRLAVLAIGVALALTVNAALIAVFSDVTGRYQGRLAWLVPLVLVLGWWRAPGAGVGDAPGAE